VQEKKERFQHTPACPDAEGIFFSLFIANKTVEVALSTVKTAFLPSTKHEITRQRLHLFNFY
jgi:hypothetical protein